MAARGRIDLHRRRRRLGRAAELRRQYARRPVRAGAAQHRSRSSPMDGAGPEHIVRMTCYVTSIDEYLASAQRDRRGVARDHGQALSGDGAGRGRAAWSSATRRSRSRRRRWCRSERDRFVEDRLPPPELLPEFRFDLPELQYPERLNAAAELLKGGAPDALAIVNDHGRWTYRRPRRFQRPHRAAAGRGGGAGPRQPRASARAERLHDVRRLARRAEGRRRGRRDHAAASPRRDRDGDRARANQPRDRRQPLHRRLPRGGRADAFRQAHRQI